MDSTACPTQRTRVLPDTCSCRWWCAAREAPTYRVQAVGTGRCTLWIIEHLFVHNELARGVLVVDGRQVDLSAVDCPIFLLAGIKDHITPPEQVWALADLVATPAGHISRELVDGGHLGLFMGRAALAEHWTPIAERVRTYSERGA
jgi:poly(3-hydroxybutyrate) depolymerase